MDVKKPPRREGVSLIMGLLDGKILLGSYWNYGTTTGGAILVSVLAIVSVGSLRKPLLLLNPQADWNRDRHVVIDETRACHGVEP